MNFRFDPKDLTRLRRIASILFKHGFGQFLSSTRFDEIAGLKKIPIVKEETHHISLPVRVRMALEELGPTFVKLGQILSCRPDIVPREYIEEFRKLQDEVPPIPWQVVQRKIETSLSRKISEVFTQVDEIPIASASIAQVHRAVLKDGREVAVKVQRPDIRGIIESDLKILYFLARVLEDTIEEIGVYTPTLIIKEFEKAILLELDFLKEGENADRFGRNMKSLDFIEVPAVFKELSSRELLILELIKGKKLTEREERESNSDVILKRIIESFVKQVFVDGYFHGDPHPGNIMILPGDRIAFLDFGLMGEITWEMRTTLLNLFISIIFKDADGVAKIIYKAAEAKDRVDLTELSKDTKKILDKYHGRRLSEVRSGTVLLEIVEGAVKHKLRLPQEYAILSRAFVNTEGIVRDLNPDLDFIYFFKPMAEKLLSERYSLESIAEDVLKTSYDLLRVLKEFPLQITQIMLDMERGKLKLLLENQTLEEIPDEVRWSSIQIVLSIIASGLMIGSSILITLNAGKDIVLSILAVIGFIIAFSMMVVIVMRIGLHKKGGLLIVRRMIEFILQRRR